jgi:hypothetical protein
MRSASRPDSRASRVARENGGSASRSNVDDGLGGGVRVRFGTATPDGGRGGGTGPWTRTTWSLRGISEGSVPYLAGRPARNWHLADLASVGCRGVNGPVPQPTLDKALFGCTRMMPEGPDRRKRVNRRRRVSHTRRRPHGTRWVQRALLRLSCPSLSKDWFAAPPAPWLAVRDRLFLAGSSHPLSAAATARC